MILVDTSVWVDHIRGRTTPLDDLLGDAQIAMHPFVLGELLLNGLPKRGGFSIEAFAKYAKAPLASATEVSGFILSANLAGTGLGYVDVHLLVSARLMVDGTLLTFDKDLLVQAERFEIAHTS